MNYCNSCGEPFELGRPRCVRCGAPLPHRPTVVPNTADVGEKASAPSRLVAGAIDVLVSWLLVFGAVLVLRRVPLLVEALVRRAATVPLLTLPNAYLGLRDSFEGKSIGKLIAGLLVYDDVQRAPGGFVASINRNWPLMVPLVGPTVVALGIGAQLALGSRRRFGEESTNTAVVSDLDFLRTRVTSSRAIE
jgi:hypothetical protein